MKKIAVLTSGGDAPGMNAAVRAVTLTAHHYGIEVLGVIRGYAGLIHDEMIPLTPDTVSDIIRLGGTILFTARSPEFHTQEGLRKAKETCQRHGIEAAIIIGGGGSFCGARDLAACDVPCIGIPGTIDNDIACCEETIGYNTAVATVVEMVDKLLDTSQSHDCCSIVEVMGHRSGWLALNSGIAVGATSILVPEVPWTFKENILDQMRRTACIGRKHFIIIVAEGVGHVSELSERIRQETGFKVRTTTLGYVQRGGSPSPKDRILANSMGNYAVHLLIDGSVNRIVASRNNGLCDFAIREALAMTKAFDYARYRMAKETAL